jgi:hypothetical protein
MPGKRVFTDEELRAKLETDRARSRESVRRYRHRLAATQPPRALPNPAEQAFSAQARRAGWMVTKAGWPDFYLERGDEIACVEVKPDGVRVAARPTRAQRRVLEGLARCGVPCYLWTPTGGFVRVVPGRATRARRAAGVSRRQRRVSGEAVPDELRWGVWA